MIEETLRRELPSDKRILIDEVYKLLLFNNEDPQTFNLQFWSDYFKIPPSALRNIVNYVAYPLCDPETKQIVKILTFIDSEL